MIQQRLFEYGGLQVRLFHSEKNGWVTTTPEVAKACGVDRSTLERVCKKHHLVRKESVIEDTELGANLHLTTRGGPKPKIFWTIEGMTFVAMYLGTETCEQFRTEVLKTIKSLEFQGFLRAEDVIKRLNQLELMITEQQKVVNQLSIIVERQNMELQRYREESVLSASFAGARLSGAKKWKHLNLVN